MRPLILITMLVLLASCRSNKHLQSESVCQSTIDTQTSSETRRTAQVDDLYSAATTIELTDITIGLRPQAQADAQTHGRAEGHQCPSAPYPDSACPQSSIHIGKATITNTTAAEKHIATSAETEDTAAHHADTSAESKQQSKSDIKTQTAQVTITFWILCGILLVFGFLYARRIRPK